MSIDRLKDEHGVKTRWVHFPLHPETPLEGIPMKELHRNRDPEERKAAGDYLRSQMAEAGLAYNRRTMLDNSRLAQELGAWADTTDKADEFHDAMYKAYFVDDKRISDKETLVGIAESVGLDGAEARKMLETRMFSPQVNADWERAWSNGVTGVPTFSSRDLYVVGSQPYEVLVRFVNHLRELREKDMAGGR